MDHNSDYDDDDKDSNGWKYWQLRLDKVDNAIHNDDDNDNCNNNHKDSDDTLLEIVYKRNPTV